MRIGLIGDVHSEDDLLASALAWLAERGAEHLLCTGDLVDGLGDPNRCCRLLAAAGVLCVRGNHDRWLLAGTMRELPRATARNGLAHDALAYLAALPATRDLVIPGGALLLCHGLGANDMNRLTPDDVGYAIEVNDELQTLLRERRYRFVVHGHTHRPMVRHFAHLTLINPGTLRRDQGPGVALLDLTEGQYEYWGLTADGSAEAPVRAPLNGGDWSLESSG